MSGSIKMRAIVHRNFSRSGVELILAMFLGLFGGAYFFSVLSPTAPLLHVGAGLVGVFGAAVAVIRLFHDGLATGRVLIYFILAVPVCVAMIFLVEIIVVSINGFAMGIVWDDPRFANKVVYGDFIAGSVLGSGVIYLGALTMRNWRVAGTLTKRSHSPNVPFSLVLIGLASYFLADIFFKISGGRLIGSYLTHLSASYVLVGLVVGGLYSLLFLARRGLSGKWPDAA